MRLTWWPAVFGSRQPSPRRGRAPREQVLERPLARPDPLLHAPEEEQRQPEPVERVRALLLFERSLEGLLGRIPLRLLEKAQPLRAPVYGHPPTLSRAGGLGRERFVKDDESFALHQLHPGQRPEALDLRRVLPRLVGFGQDHQAGRAEADQRYDGTDDRE